MEFSKKQIIKSDRYGEYRDVLAVLLEENQSYSIEEIDKIVKDFKERVFNKKESDE